MQESLEAQSIAGSFPIENMAILVQFACLLKMQAPYFTLTHVANLWAW